MSWKTLWCMTHLELGFYFIKKKRQFILSNFVDCSAKNGTEHPLPINRGVGWTDWRWTDFKELHPRRPNFTALSTARGQHPWGISITGISGTGWWFPLLWKTNSALVGGFQIRDVNQTSNHCSCLTMIVGYYPLLTSVNHYNPNSSTVAIHPTVTRSFSSARGSPKRSRSRMILAALSVARWSNPGFAVLIKSYWV